MEKWILFSLLYPTLYSFAALIDKYVVSKKVKNPYSWVAYISVIRVFFAVIVFFAFSMGSAPFYALAAAFIAGAANAIFHFLYFKSVAKSDISIIAGLTFSAPVLVAVLAVVFLGEHLTLLKAFAILIAAAGAVLISLKKDLDLRKFYVGMVFWVMMVAILMYAIHDVTVRYVSPVMSVWYILVVTSLGFFATTAAFTLRFRKMRLGFFEIFKTPMALFLGFLNEIIAVVGSVLFLTAVSLQQVSYVSAFAAMIPVLVFFWTIILSIFAPYIITEELKAGVLAQKFIAILLVVAGVLIITLI